MAQNNKGECNMNKSTHRPLGHIIRLLLMAVLVMAFTLNTRQTARAFASPATVNLGRAASFSILSKAGITTTGTTAITGNIGVSPIAATAMTGFGLTLDSSNTFSISSLVTGKVYAANYASPTPANMTTAVANMETAYTDAAGRAPNATGLGAGDISGLSFAPGVYKWSTDVSILTGDVTLSGSSTDIWIFQMSGDLLVAAGRQVVLSGGAQASNVFWQVGGGTGATINAGAHVEGTILAAKGIVFKAGASLNGRALAQTNVTLISNTIVIPVCVLSITRVNINPTTSSSVDFMVTFSEAVIGVDISDFSLTTTGSVSGATVTGVSGSGSVYTVTVNTGTGSGMIYLDVPLSATVTDLAGHTLCGLPFTSGESYTVRSIDVYIGGALQGSYLLAEGESVRPSYVGVDSGPVKVISTNGDLIISSIRDAWAVNGMTTSFAQMMGLPSGQLSNKYVFPGYNNVTLNEQLRISNVDTVPSTVTVTVGGVPQGSPIILQPNEQTRINYPGLDSGPVVVQGTVGVKIISSIREAWAVNGVTTSFVQFMGLPAEQLSNKYVFPAYNNVTLNEQLRIGNVDTVVSTVIVTIGGVPQGSPITLQPNEAVRINYPGLDSGPVIVEGTVGVKIISSIRSAWAVNGVTTSFSQLMGLPAGALSDTYMFPAYNNVTLNEQLRIANVDTVPSTVTVTIGGVPQGSPVTLQPNEAMRINYPGLDSGPVIVQGTTGVKIISAIRDAWAVNGVTQSFVQLMGLPSGQLSSTFWFPAYNNVTLNEQLRIAVP
jgi:hypothetical protein